MSTLFVAPEGIAQNLDIRYEMALILSGHE